MKRGGFGRQILLAFIVSVIGYAAFFGFIQHRRIAKGPWQVIFTADSVAPAIIVNQATLGIRDVRIVFADERTGTKAAEKMEFSQARAVPFDLPFGRCVFLDPLFLPGTVTLEMFGHEIQLMPRVLTIDKVERPWRNGESIELLKISTPR